MHVLERRSQANAIRRQSPPLFRLRVPPCVEGLAASALQAHKRQDSHHKVAIKVPGIERPPFLHEDMADNALVYASIKVMQTYPREDDWHTDGGSSLLHAGLTVFGSRSVDIELLGKGCISLRQQPGSFYVGNMCAMNHRVVHKDSDEGAYRGETDPVEPVHIAVMLRSDVFRSARARNLNATPGPRELFDIVNEETALHLAEQPFRLPSLAEVVAESRR